MATSPWYNSESMSLCETVISIIMMAVHDELACYINSNNIAALL